MRSKLCVIIATFAMFAAACGGSDATNEVVVDSSSSDSSDAESAPASVDEAAEPDDATDDDQAADDVGGADGADADGSDEADDPTPSESDAASDLAASVADEDDPLAALLGFTDFEDPAFIVESQRRVDELTQRCMIEQGFEYTPQNLDPEDFAFGRAIAPGLSDAEFAAEYGYGVAASVDGLLQLVNRGNDDPNSQRLAEMSEGEAQAWQQAMLGSNIDIDPETGQPLDPATGEPIDPMLMMMQGDGCALTANREVFGSFEALFVLQSQFADLEDRFNGDRRVVEITDEWSTCMGSAGYDYAALDEPVEAFNMRVDALVEPLFGAMMQVPGGDEPEPISLGPDEQAELDALRQEEIAVAVTDLECLGDASDELDDVRRSIELEFIDDNAEALADALG